MHEVTLKKRRQPLELLQQQLDQAPPCRPFAQTLTALAGTGELAIIAECKKASPGRGIIRRNYDAAQIARDYESAGAACVSVLTDQRYFQGDFEHLAAVRSACSLPLLAKDFIIDPYQVFEARLAGADCILIMAACLSDVAMRDLAQLAGDLEMDVLVEIHDREELERGLLLRTPLIGINNRDPRTFRADVQTTVNLLLDIFPDRTIVTESGITTREDIALMRRNSVNAFLVGEAFMTATEPGAKLRELFFD